MWKRATKKSSSSSHGITTGLGYQGNDLELLVFMPGFPALPFGQTLDAPEKFVINSEVLTALLGAHQPVPLPTGTWTMEVLGFEVNSVKRVRGKRVPC